MPNVLSVDLEPRADLPDFQGPRWLPAGTACVRVKASREPVPESAAGFTHVILSGSTDSVLEDTPASGSAMRLVRDAVRRRTPVLGICYGHQLVVRALLGKEHVRRSPTPEFGWLPVHPVPGFEWLHEGLPDPFRTFVAHFDEVRDLPPAWRLTARSEGCAVQGYVNEELRVVGFQYHPEMDLEVGNRCFVADREPFARLGVDVDLIVREAADDEPGRLLFPRFLARTWE